VNTKKISRLLAVVGMVGLAGTAYASTTFVAADTNGVPLSVFGFSTFAVTGADMNGMLVKVTFDDNSTSITTWSNTSATAGAASGAVTGGGTWSLSENGNTGLVAGPTIDGTAENPWTLINTSTVHAITSIQLTGGILFNGNVVFDRNLSVVGTPLVGIQEGTPGSSFGVTFSNTGSPNPPADSGNFTATATYSNIVTLLGASQACNGAGFSTKNTATGCGDAWQSITIAFSGTSFIANGGTAAQFSFFQDTDVVGVPEPVTFGLVGLGLLGVAAFRRRRV